MEGEQASWPGVSDYIGFAESLKLRTHSLAFVQSVRKLERRIDAELRFLHSLEKRHALFQKTALKSSNLSHFASIIDAAQRLPGVTQILTPFTVPFKDQNLLIDLVAGKGHLWVKVIARKAQALQLIWEGQGQFGERDLLSQASEYLLCAQNHPYEFITPQVHFAFYNGVTAPMAEALKALGVTTWGQILPVTAAIENPVVKLDIKEDGEESPSLLSQSDALQVSLYPESPTPNKSEDFTDQNKPNELSSAIKTSEDLFLHLVLSPPVYDHALLGFVNDQVRSIRRVNLDTTTLIALVSSVTNGICHVIFKDKALTHQAKEERESPILPVLQNYLTGKEIFVCETAWSSFQSILSTLGGPQERERASDLLSMVCLIKDQPSERTLALKCHGRIKARSKVIFGTGDTIKAVTLTSNMGFVRASKSQGVRFSVFVHPARALTEDKEKQHID